MEISHPDGTDESNKVISEPAIITAISDDKKILTIDKEITQTLSGFTMVFKGKNTTGDNPTDPSISKNLLFKKHRIGLDSNNLESFEALKYDDNIGDILFKGSKDTTHDITEPSYFDSASISCEIDGAAGDSDMPGRLTFFTSADGSSTLTERMRITNDGKLGIGVTNPNDTVHVYHATDNYVARFESGDAGGGIVLKDPTHSTTLITNDGDFTINVDNGGDVTGESIRFEMSGSEKVRITSGGLVGINTSVPTAQLSFLAKRTTQTYPPICFQTSYGAGLADAAISTTDDTGGTDIMIGSNVFMGQNGTFTRYYSSYGSAAVRCMYTGTTIFYNKSGNNAPAESMRIDGDGQILIGHTDSVGSGKLQVFTKTADAIDILSFDQRYYLFKATSFTFRNAYYF